MVPGKKNCSGAIHHGRESQIGVHSL